MVSRAKVESSESSVRAVSFRSNAASFILKDDRSKTARRPAHTSIIRPEIAGKQAIEGTGTPTSSGPALAFLHLAELKEPT
jgi:hypothetical protein